MIENQKSEVFWEIIDVLRQSSLLPHIMIIGSWAEYLYPYCLGKDYLPNLKTRDVDVYFGNPYLEVDGAESLIENFQDAGFLLDEHFVDTGKFFKNGIEVEFLSSQVGSGPGVIEIPFTGVKAEKLCDLNMLKPIWVEVRGYEIKIPSPVSYALHK
ncbi:MAG: GSU2403 family nucleotidyltransferase fold protein, partial [Raoultibacter sp.]